MAQPQPVAQAFRQAGRTWDDHYSVEPSTMGVADAPQTGPEARVQNAVKAIKPESPRASAAAPVAKAVKLSASNATMLQELEKKHKPVSGGFRYENTQVVAARANGKKYTGKIVTSEPTNTSGASSKTRKKNSKRVNATVLSVSTPAAAAQAVPTTSAAAAAATTSSVKTKKVKMTEAELVATWTAAVSPQLEPGTVLPRPVDLEASPAPVSISSPVPGTILPNPFASSNLASTKVDLKALAQAREAREAAKNPVEAPVSSLSETTSASLASAEAARRAETISPRSHTTLAQVTSTVANSVVASAASAASAPVVAPVLVDAPEPAMPAVPETSSRKKVWTVLAVLSGAAFLTACVMAGAAAAAFFLISAPISVPVAFGVVGVIAMVASLVFMGHSIKKSVALS